ncbi:hypothetical protein CAPTEDRAFT_164915 [Capitella teleta]|uniref:Aquaporin-3 n=1 Tax=Capitella teleta TaxID=283909 RepID=R7TSF6_CAPTE|nr:hypothetical protein CAPTEDRAFT_164915 [Capitella teleta]|eukprot:ELT96542.1 hypothetical protein CAPTEDRAFT_164915 [Capitella teleta]
MSISFRKRLKSALRIKHPILKGMLAEFLGTFVLVVFGDGSVAQVVLSKGAAGTFLTINIAWGFAVAMGVWVSGGVSGGHINPAVTLTLCLMGREKWRRLIPYWLAQYIGAFVASACVYGVYIDALNEFDGGTRSIRGTNGTAGIWSTFPQEFLTAKVGLADQILATGLLVCMVLAITDKNNMGAPKSLVPLAVGSVVAVIGMSFGYNCGYAINPARDWGPRMFTALAGWGRGCWMRIIPEMDFCDTEVTIHTLYTKTPSSLSLWFCQQGVILKWALKYDWMYRDSKEGRKSGLPLKI